jgi:hypothetical protein
MGKIEKLLIFQFYPLLFKENLWFP